MTQQRIPAVYMRGGTSKGVFFRAEVLPADPVERDRVLLRVILSWFMPYGMRQNPAGDLLVSLTEPLMRPARRLIPAVGGLDLSPIVVLVGRQLLQLALAHLLRQ